MGRGGWRERGPILKAKGKQHAVMTKGGSIVVVSQLSRRLRKGGRRVHRPPKPRPKMRVPGDELMRALVGQRTYASLARAVGRYTAEVSLFCRGHERNPSLKTIERFARALAVDEAKVIEALRALWQGQPAGKDALTSYKGEVRAQRAPALLPAEGRVQERAPVKVRPSLQRLIEPPAAFRRPHVSRYEEDAPLTLGLAGRDQGLDGDTFTWPDD
jgi:hypothetical protein